MSPHVLVVAATPSEARHIHAHPPVHTTSIGEVTAAVAPAGRDTGVDVLVDMRTTGTLRESAGGLVGRLGVMARDLSTVVLPPWASGYRRWPT